DGQWLGFKFSEEQRKEREMALGVRIRVTRADSIEAMLSAIEHNEVDAWLIPVTDKAAMGRVELIAALKRSRKPALFGRTLFVSEGGLASYQEVIREPMALWHEAMMQILRGTPAGKIPVRRPHEFE